MSPAGWSTPQEALRIGLADRVVPAERGLRRRASSWSPVRRAGPVQALRAAKLAVDGGLDMDLTSGLEIERVKFAGLFATEDQKSGMKSFVEEGPGKARFGGR